MNESVLIDYAKLQDKLGRSVAYEVVRDCQEGETEVEKGEQLAEVINLNPNCRKNVLCILRNKHDGECVSLEDEKLQSARDNHGRYIVRLKDNGLILAIFDNKEEASNHSAVKVGAAEVIG